MGLFNGIKNNYKKSEAAVVVQNLFEHQASLGNLSVDPAKFATALVARLWEQKVEWFDGTYGQRPHRVTVAAGALAHGVQLLPESDANRFGVLMALASVLSQLEKDAPLFAFNGIDERLLSYAVGVASDEADRSDTHASEPSIRADAAADGLLESKSADQRKEVAQGFIDAQLANGSLTVDQLEYIRGMLLMSSTMTGNLQEAYEILNSKPVPTEAFQDWLDNDQEGRLWKALWVLVRQGMFDTDYRPAP